MLWLQHFGARHLGKPATSGWHGTCACIPAMPAGMRFARMHRAALKNNIQHRVPPCRPPSNP